LSQLGHQTVKKVCQNPRAPVVVSVATAPRHLRREGCNGNDSLDVQTGLGMLATMMQRGSQTEIERLKRSAMAENRRAIVAPTA
jgi:hypothetical protein